MGEINPVRSDLMTDDDVNYALFSCCGDEDLVFLRCRHCDHIWVECFECSTWFVNLADLSERQSCFLTSADGRLACPQCEVPFEDARYLETPQCDRYLATRAQVVAAGWTRFLSPSQQQAAQTESRVKQQQLAAIQSEDAQRKWIAIGAAVGAGGWLWGFALKLISLGLVADAVVPLLAAFLILIMGIWIWRQRQQGHTITLFLAVQSLLAASAILGVMVLIFLQQRGTLELAIDPDGRFPRWVNFLAPLVIVVMMAIVFIPAIHRRLSQERL